MSNESHILLSNFSNDSSPLAFVYSDKQKGAGYHKFNDGLHTAVFQFDNFKGSVKLQGTLELYPGDRDWFDIIYDNGESQLEALDSTPLVSSATRNFTGKFVWVRAACQLEQGTITEIRYNY